MTTRGLSPCARRKVAQVCRRSWNLWRGRPAASSVAWNLLLNPRPSSPVPTVDVNTNPVSSQRSPASSRSRFCRARSLDAYGWPRGLTDEAILERLLALNL